MPISRDDAWQTSDIQQNVRAGRPNGSYDPGQYRNPGHQTYRSAGDHGTEVLPSAARKQTHYDYPLHGTTDGASSVDPQRRTEIDAERACGLLYGFAARSRAGERVARLGRGKQPTKIRCALVASLPAICECSTRWPRPLRPSFIEDASV